MLSRKSLIFSCSLGNFFLFSPPETELSLSSTTVICRLHMIIVSIRIAAHLLCVIFITFVGPLVFNAIRAIHPLTPILILGGKHRLIHETVVCSNNDHIGHTHIRDCRMLSLVLDWRMPWAQLCLVQLDGRSMSLESGRYMETVGKKNAGFDLVHSADYVI